MVGTAREERSFAHPAAPSLRLPTRPDRTLSAGSLAFRYTVARDHNFGIFGNEDFRGAQPIPLVARAITAILPPRPAYGTSLLSNDLMPMANTD